MNRNKFCEEGRHHRMGFSLRLQSERVLGVVHVDLPYYLRDFHSLALDKNILSLKI